MNQLTYLTAKERELFDWVEAEFKRRARTDRPVAHLLVALLNIAFPDPATSDFETGEYCHEMTAETALSQFRETVELAK